MKTFIKGLLGILLFTFTFGYVKAQEKGSGNVTTEIRSLGSFDAIKVGCAINLFISQGGDQIIKVQTDDNLQKKIITKVVNGTLELECEKLHFPTKMDVIVTVPQLSKIEAEGASVVTGETPVKANVFSLLASGAAKVYLTVESEIFNDEISGAAKATLTVTSTKANSEISGAGDLTLSGNATSHSMEVSGAGTLKALDFITDETNAEVTGAGNARITARKQLKAELSGVGSVTYYENNNLKKIAKPGKYQLNFEGMDHVKSVTIEDENNADNTVIRVTPSDDSVSIVIHDKKIIVVTDDSVKVKLGDRSYEFGEDGVKVKRGHKHPKFNGHWAGFELGVNGLLNSENNIDLPAGYGFLDLNYNKSINVNLNFFEQNFNLINNHLGLVTGLGFSWNNYRFDKNVRLTDDGILGGYYDNDPNRHYEKSKLVVSYLTLPLLLEYQTNSKSKASSFHIAGGVQGGLRLGSHTKIVYNDGDRRKDKDPGQFYIAPFKVDAVAKIGWGIINLYGTYSLTEMFRTNKGPQVYPFAVGICLDTF